MLAEMNRNRVLDKLFGQSIEGWTQSSVFVNFFTRQALASSSRAAHLVAKFTRENLKGQSEVIGRAENSLDSPFSFPRADSSCSKFSGDEKYRKRVKNKRKKRFEPNYLSIKSKEQKGCKQRRKKLSSSSGSSLGIPTTPQSLDQKSVGTHPKPLKAKQTEPQLPVVRMMKKHYMLAGDHRTYRVADSS